MQIDTKEIAVIKGQISKLENKANTVVITSQEEYASAIDLVSKLKDIGSQIKNTKESITKPLNEALKNARSLFSPLEEQFEKAEAIIKSKILAWKQLMDRKAQEAEQKIAQKVESGAMKIETAERKMENIERVESTTQGKVGEVQIRIIKKVRITDESLLPRKYLVPDTVAIRRDALGGTPIPGVEVYNEETVAAR